MKKFIINALVFTLIFRVTFYDKELKVKRSGRVAGWVALPYYDDGVTTTESTALVDVCDKYGRELHHVRWKDLKGYEWEEVKSFEENKALDITKTTESQNTSKTTEKK